MNKMKTYTAYIDFDCNGNVVDSSFYARSLEEELIVQSALDRILKAAKKNSTQQPFSKFKRAFSCGLLSLINSSLEKLIARKKKEA